MHPLINDLSDFKESDLESKINELTKKYFLTYNPQIQQQIVQVLDTYKEELHRRRQIEWEKMNESRNKDLDKLININ